MKVLVTGHKGYIGCHLVELLKDRGHWVTGCDVGLYEGCEWSEVPVPQRTLQKDFRALTHDELIGHDCLIHLAALSNDPMGRLKETVTYAVNQYGTVQLALKAKQAAIPRFLFAASCAAYGRKGSEALDETASFEPQSAYAKSKVEAEHAISLLADATFCPVSLRNATAHGASPMLRLDLVANNLLASACALQEIRVTSDGSPWRPLIHCRDIARAFVGFLEAPTEIVFNQAVNIGGNQENYQVKDIVDRVLNLVPKASVVYTGEVGADPRSYRINCDRLSQLLPDFKLEYSLETSLEELYQQLRERRFSAADFHGDRYFRLRAIKNRFHLLEAGG